MNGMMRSKGAIAHSPIDRIPFYCDELFVDTERQWLDEGLPAAQADREDLFYYDFTELFIDSSMRFEPKWLEENEETMTVADKYGFIATRNKLIPGIHFHEYPVKNIKRTGSVTKKDLMLTLASKAEFIKSYKFITRFEVIEAKGIESYFLQ